MTITLPYPPSVNHYYRHVGNKTLISREGREYRRAVELECLLAADCRYMGKVRVTAAFYPPDRRRRDLDNLGKSLLDALQAAGVYADDSQIKSLTLQMADFDPDVEPHAVVTVEPL